MNRKKMATALILALGVCTGHAAFAEDHAEGTATVNMELLAPAGLTYTATQPFYAQIGHEKSLTSEQPIGYIESMYATPQEVYMKGSSTTLATDGAVVKMMNTDEAGVEGPDLVVYESEMQGAADGSGKYTFEMDEFGVTTVMAKLLDPTTVTAKPGEYVGTFEYGVIVE